MSDLYTAMRPLIGERVAAAVDVAEETAAIDAAKEGGSKEISLSLMGLPNVVSFPSLPSNARC